MGNHTFVSSLRSCRSTRRGSVVRVAVGRIHILVVVGTRLRRPETDGGRQIKTENKCDED